MFEMFLNSLRQGLALFDYLLKYRREQNGSGVG